MTQIYSPEYPSATPELTTTLIAKGGSQKAGNYESQSRSLGTCLLFRTVGPGHNGPGYAPLHDWSNRSIVGLIIAGQVVLAGTDHLASGFGTVVIFIWEY